MKMKQVTKILTAFCMSAAMMASCGEAVTEDAQNSADVTEKVSESQEESSQEAEASEDVSESQETEV